MTLFFILPYHACVIMTQLNRWIILEMMIRLMSSSLGIFEPH